MVKLTLLLDLSFIIKIINTFFLKKHINIEYTCSTNLNPL